MSPALPQVFVCEPPMFPVHEFQILHVLEEHFKDHAVLQVADVQEQLEHRVGDRPVFRSIKPEAGLGFADAFGGSVYPLAAGANVKVFVRVIVHVFLAKGLVLLLVVGILLLMKNLQNKPLMTP